LLQKVEELVLRPFRVAEAFVPRVTGVTTGSGCSPAMRLTAPARDRDRRGRGWSAALSRAEDRSTNIRQRGQLSLTHRSDPQQRRSVFLLFRAASDRRASALPPSSTRRARLRESASISTSPTLADLWWTYPSFRSPLPDSWPAPRSIARRVCAHGFASFSRDG
jgi:hypothetical protein